MKFLNPIFFEPLSAHCNSVSATRKDNRDTVVSGRTFTESGGERRLEGALRRKRFPLRALPSLSPIPPPAFPTNGRAPCQRPPAPKDLPPDDVSPASQSRRSGRLPCARRPTLGTLEFRRPLGRQFLPEDLIVSDSPPSRRPPLLRWRWGPPLRCGNCPRTPPRQNVDSPNLDDHHEDRVAPDRRGLLGQLGRGAHR